MTLTKNFSWTLAGGVVGALANWLTLLLFARAGSAELLGVYSMSTAIILPILTFSKLQLRGVQATDAAGDAQFVDYFGLRLLTSFGIAVILVCIVQFGVVREGAVAIFVASAVKLIIDSVIDIFSGLFQQHERLDWIAQYQIGNAVFTIVALGTGFIFLNSAVWALGLSSVVSLVVLVFGVGPRAISLLSQQGGQPSLFSVHSFSFLRMRHLFILALPMGLVTALGSLNGALPRLFVGAWGGSAELGYFTAVLSLVTIGSTIFSALGHSASPRLAKYYATGNLPKFLRLTRVMVLMAAVAGFALVIAAWSTGPEIVEALYGQEFAGDTSLISAVAVLGALMFITSMLGYINTATRQFKVQVPINLAATITLVAVCILLIPHYHLPGAAVAMICSLLVKLSLASAAVWVAVRNAKRVLLLSEV